MDELDDRLEYVRRLTTVKRNNEIKRKRETEKDRQRYTVELMTLLRRTQCSWSLNGGVKYVNTRQFVTHILNNNVYKHMYDRLSHTNVTNNEYHLSNFVAINSTSR